jgi:hypothetical protein
MYVFWNFILSSNSMHLTSSSPVCFPQTFLFFKFQFILLILFKKYFYYIFSSITFPTLSQKSPIPSPPLPYPPIPIFFGPGVPLNWGIYSLRVQWASLSSDGQLGHLLIHFTYNNILDYSPILSLIHAFCLFPQLRHIHRRQFIKSLCKI